MLDLGPIKARAKRATEVRPGLYLGQDADYAYISHALVDIPDLIAEVEQLRTGRDAGIAALRALLEAIDAHA